jgi:predicted ArsR family transcriptional regulator
MSDELKNGVELMARALAMYHAIFANEAIDMLGEDKGTELVKKVVARFGRERGKKIREASDAKGQTPTLASMSSNYDLPLSAAWESVKYEDGSDITYCPMREEWVKMEMTKEGKLYCAVDAAMAEGYSDDLVFLRLCTLMDGDSCCRHRYTSKK